MQVCPSLLIKKDRGRPIDSKARPKAYGEVNVASDVPDVELLQTIKIDDEESGHSDDSACSVSDNDQDNDDDDNQLSGDDDDNQLSSEDDEAEDNDVISEDEVEGDSDSDYSDAYDEVAVKGNDIEDSEQDDEEDGDVPEHEEDDDGNVETKSTFKDLAKKRKFTDFDGQLIAADTSLRALKKLAGEKIGDALPESGDGILSNEDFKRIKELKVGLAYSASTVSFICYYLSVEFIYVIYRQKERQKMHWLSKGW